MKATPNGISGEQRHDDGTCGRMLSIGQKLGVAIPAGLLLFCGVNASAMSHDTPSTVCSSVGNLSEATVGNEVARHLVEMKGDRGNVQIADNKDPLHGDSHVNVNDPDVKTNYTDNGHHTDQYGKVHTDNHGDANRY